MAVLFNGKITMKYILLSLIVATATITGLLISPIQATRQAYVEPNAYEHLINDQRSQRGLKTLASSDKLRQSACMKAQDMLDKDYWSHDSPTGITPWYWFDAAGYKYSSAGENLSRNNGEETISAWLNSQSHKNTMLGEYAEMGVCTKSNSQQEVTVLHIAKS